MPNHLVQEGPKENPERAISPLLGKGKVSVSGLSLPYLLLLPVQAPGGNRHFVDSLDFFSLFRT